MIPLTPSDPARAIVALNKLPDSLTVASKGYLSQQALAFQRAKIWDDSLNTLSGSLGRTSAD